MRKIIVFEGIAGSGKTSCFAHLAKTLPDEYIFLSEINPEPSEDWMHFPPSLQGDYFDQFSFERMQILQDASHVSFVLDRSYLSNLAYWYAHDHFFKTAQYPLRKKFALEHFYPHLFTSIYIFHCPASLSVQRRELAGIPIPHPWGEIDFLKAFDAFYTNELTSLVKANTQIFNTEKVTTAQIAKEILDTLMENKRYQMQTEGYEIFDAFAQKDQLGNPISTLRHVFGYPTLYYRQHSLQLDDKNIVYFNNKQLKKLIHAYK